MPEPALTVLQFGRKTVLLCHFVLTNEMNRSDFFCVLWVLDYIQMCGRRHAGSGRSSTVNLTCNGSLVEMDLFLFPNHFTMLCHSNYIGHSSLPYIRYWVVAVSLLSTLVTFPWLYCA